MNDCTECRRSSELLDLFHSCANDDQIAKFHQAVILANSLFDRNDCERISCSSMNGRKHAIEIEEYLGHFILGGGPPQQHDFNPSAEQMLYLLSAAWLHEIGSIYGIFDQKERLPIAEGRREHIYQTHETRTAEYIRDIWRVNCAWERDQIRALMQICQYHRRNRILDDIASDSIKELTALFRVADSLSEIKIRPPDPIFTQGLLFGITAKEMAEYWTESKLVAQFDFDRDTETIFIKSRLPKRESELCGFNLGEIVRLVVGDVRREVENVKTVLARYANLRFTKVVSSEDKDTDICDIRKLFYCIWPRLVLEPDTSAEVADALAQVLKFAIRQSALNGQYDKNRLREELKKKFEVVQKYRPTFFVIETMKRWIMEKVDDDMEHDELCVHLKAFQKKIKKNSVKVAKRYSEVITSESVIVVYGYCRTIQEILELIKRDNGEKTTLCIIDDGSGDDRLAKIAGNQGYRHTEIIPLSAAPCKIDALVGSQSSVVLLLSAYGVKPGEGFFCKIGTRSIIISAKHANNEKEGDLKIVFMADSLKVVKHAASVSTLLEEDWAAAETKFEGVFRISPKSEFVSVDLADLMLKEDEFTSIKDV